MVGNEAGNLLQSGSRNIGLGFRAFYNPSGFPIGVTTGNDNVAIGFQSGTNITTGSNNFVIGSNARVQSATASDQMNIKNSIFGTGMNGTLAAPGGNIGINVSAPSNTLHVFAVANPVRFQGLQTGTITGVTPDNIVVADNNGVLKTVAASVFLPSVRNGLMNNAATAGFTELGGDLRRETIIATTISGITYPLKITGLPFGDNDDQIMVVDNGQLKMVNQSTVAIEPWQVQGFTSKATANNEAIYQNAKVAVGNFSTGGAAGVSTKQLEVKGDFKSEHVTVATGNTTGTEVNSPLLVAGGATEGTVNYWRNTAGAANFFAVDNLNARAVSMDNIAVPTKVSNFIVTNNSVEVYSKHGGEAKQGTLEVNGNDGRFALYANSHADNWGAMVKSDNTNGLLLYHAGSSAALGNVNGNDRSMITIKKGQGINFLHNNASGALFGTYTFPTASGTTGQVLTKGAGNDIVWANTSTFGAAANGLTKNATTGVFELGGDLNRATTIATTISGTTYPLAITGLPSDGALTDNVIVASTGGQLKMIPGSSITNIYNSNGTLTGNRTVNTSTFSLTFGSGSNRVVVNNTSGTSSILSANGSSRGNVRAIANNSSILDMFVDDASNAQVVAGGTATGLVVGTNLGSAAPLSLNTNGVTRIQATATGLVGIGIGANLASEQLDVVSGNVRVREINASYTLKAADKIVVSDNDAVLRTVNQSTLVAAPKFFYAPSMVMPTSSVDLPAHVTFNAVTSTFTVDMYAVYSNQFGMTGDVPGASRTAIKSAGSGSLSVLAASDLGYFVTYFDNTVYDPSSISLTTDGKLSYRILAGATVTVKTYMNVVFKQL